MSVSWMDYRCLGRSLFSLFARASDHCGTVCLFVYLLCSLPQLPCSVYTVYITASALQRLHCAHYCTCPASSALHTTAASLQLLHCVHYCSLPAASALCTLLQLPHSVCTVFTTAPAPHHLHCAHYCSLPAAFPHQFYLCFLF